MDEIEDKTCSDCRYFTGEECDGYSNEGSERYDDSPACEDFEPVKECIAIGFNFTHRGHHDYPWGGVMVVDGYTTKDWPIFCNSELVGVTGIVDHGLHKPELVDDYIEQLEERSYICRIWKYFNDGTRECVFYYEYDG